jgi:glycosyltransferase involved in cell wall biosynthesis
MEAHPIPITEALASRTPTVTSNVFGLKELAGDAAILVDPANADEIAQGVVHLLSDADARERLRERARERSKLFTWARCASETLDIIHAIARREV